ncbi:GNAT family N-acetyltransferase [Kordiimonas sp. SCSIO 12610]|uniref:GNAT family N-acetyltransferase n=1 Tax=Kordiimonas sp. SCSIO 12610 TaxID=2829597 RepID=UPI00210878D1|nr:GNAT family N-acetyltransferase [Kordiimonas sp. SCSIO 12610]UTW56313.1 GNAT family N-acetyltransferase [Kordiimonas sp. SCSIO 12610]
MIRDYQSADFNQLISAWLAASKLAHPFLTEEFLRKEIANIRDIYIPNTETAVYQHGDTVIGFISLMGDEVGAIFLDPKYHGQKIGKALMDHAADQRNRLELDVFKANHIGQQFYFRYGFQKLYEHMHEETGNMLLRLAYTPPKSNYI